jgi:hypothetical protein
MRIPDKVVMITLTRPSAFAKATADKSDTLSHPMGEGRGEGAFGGGSAALCLLGLFAAERFLK